MTEDEFMEHVQRAWNALPLHDAYLAMGVLGYLCNAVVALVEEHDRGAGMRWMATLQRQFDKEGIET